MADSKMKALVITSLMIVLAMALTPAIGSFTIDAQYQPVQDVKTIVSGTSNSTSALTYHARNDSATYGYFIITLDQANEYGVTTVNVATNITYTTGTKVVLFKTGVFDKTKTYICTINYFTLDLTDAASLALIVIVPLLWVVIILAIGIIAIYEQLKHSTG
jgi:hypothetical protein